MAITTKTITGKIVIPGTTIGIRAQVTATPMTCNSALKFPADNTIGWGPVSAFTDSAGIMAPLKIPVGGAPTGVLWRFVATPLDKVPGLTSWTMGTFDITADADLSALVPIEPTAFPPGANPTDVTVAGFIDSGTSATTTAFKTRMAAIDADAGSAFRVQLDARVAAKIAADVPDASTTVKGRVELATTAETTTGTDTGRAVTPAGVKAAIDALVNGAPGALDTLKEFSDALGADANFAATTAASLANKVPKWKASTVYALGETVLAPDGTLVKAKVAFTSGAAYNATNWTSVATSAGTQAQTELKAAYVEVREAPLSPYRYGFVGDGVVDDAAALQATLDALPANGGQITLPHTGNARITTALNITKPTKIVGRGSRTQRIVAAGCDAFHIALNSGPVHLEGFELYTDRWNVTPHTLVGVKALGTDPARMTGHIYRDLFFDGFQTAMQVGYLWESSIENVVCSSGQIGLDVYGLSVNDTITNCNLKTSSAGSRTIRFSGTTSPTDSTPVTCEGWMISDNVIYGGETNLELSGVHWFNIGDNIIDWSGTHGILINNTGTIYGGNHRIHDNFVASYQGTAGIRILNGIENPGRSRNVIHDNEILGYGTGVTYGILADGAYASSTIHSNVIKNSTTFDILVGTPDCKVYGNVLLSAIANNLRLSSPAEAFGNTGTVQTSGDDDAFQRGPRGRSTLSGTAVPTTGTWAVGDRKQNSSPAVGQPRGWVCTVAGTPGTWVSEGIVKADDTWMTDSGWASPTLLNGWVNYGAGLATTQYRKIGDRVTIKGVVKSGTTAAGTAIFALPAGFRPSETVTFTVLTGTTLASIAVKATGNVEVNTGATATDLALNCSFLVN